MTDYEGVDVSDGTCLEDDCTHEGIIRGLCRPHYGRHHRAGTLDTAAAPPLHEPADIHRLSDLDAVTRTAVCSICGPVRVRMRPAPRRPECMTVRLRGGISTRRKRWKYGLTQAEFDRLVVAAEGACQICGTDLDVAEQRVDHCHETGAVRGILCHRCNVGLGWFNDSTTSLLAAYLYLNANGKVLDHAS